MGDLQSWRCPEPDEHGIIASEGTMGYHPQYTVELAKWQGGGAQRVSEQGEAMVARQWRVSRTTASGLTSQLSRTHDLLQNLVRSLLWCNKRRIQQ
jgi:hypothetical protein